MKLPATRRSRFSSLFEAGILLLAVWGTAAVLVALQLILYHHYDWRVMLPFTLFDSIPFVVISPVVIWFATVVQIHAGTWKWALPAHIVVCLLLSFSVDYGLNRALSSGLITLPRPAGFARNLDDAMRPGRPAFAEPGPSQSQRDQMAARRAAWRKAFPEANESPNRPPGFGLGAGPARFMRTRYIIPIYFALVAIAHAYTFQRRDQERRQNAILVQAQLDEARLRTLQMQLQPHFLFNTLNAISSLVATQPQAAETMICALSDLLRDVLATTDQSRIPLAAELDTLDRYLAIQHLRFGDRLTIEREIEPDLDDVGVPPLLLQPIAENTFQHGLGRHAGPRVLRLSIQRVGDQLSVRFTDRSPTPAPASPPTSRPLLGPGLGLANTRDRLVALYGDQAQLHSRPLPHGFETELLFPCQHLTSAS